MDLETAEKESEKLVKMGYLGYINDENPEACTLIIIAKNDI